MARTHQTCKGCYIFHGLWNGGIFTSGEARGFWVIYSPVAHILMFEYLLPFYGKIQPFAAGVFYTTAFWQTIYCQDCHFLSIYCCHHCLESHITRMWAPVGLPLSKHATVIPIFCYYYTLELYFITHQYYPHVLPWHTVCVFGKHLCVKLYSILLLFSCFAAEH